MHPFHPLGLEIRTRHPDAKVPRRAAVLLGDLALAQPALDGEHERRPADVPVAHEDGGHGEGGRQGGREVGGVGRGGGFLVGDYWGARFMLAFHYWERLAALRRRVAERG